MNYFKIIEKQWELCCKRFDIFLPFCHDQSSNSPVFLTRDKKAMVNSCKLNDWFLSISYFEDFSSFCQLVFLHEWGHYHDIHFDTFLNLKRTFFEDIKSLKYDRKFIEMLYQYKTHLLEFEHRAWDFAKRHATDICPDSFVLFQTDCLRTYENQIFTIEQTHKFMNPKK